jgi:aspartokinase-like uncharacterized kinase
MSKFEKGQSGNPKGRPPSQHKNELVSLRELITVEDVQGILKTIVEQAKAGDIQAAKLILDKVLPSLKSIDVQNNEATEPEERIVTFQVIRADGYSPDNGA